MMTILIAVIAVRLIRTSGSSAPVVVDLAVKLPYQITQALVSGGFFAVGVHQLPPCTLKPGMMGDGYGLQPSVWMHSALR